MCSGDGRHIGWAAGSSKSAPRPEAIDSEWCNMNFLNGSIHRHHPQTESETAALVGPLGGFEYVGSRRVGSDLTPADHAALESRWIDPEMARRAGLRRVDSLTGGEIVGRRGGGDYSGMLIPSFLPGPDQLRDYRLRADHPALHP